MVGDVIARMMGRVGVSEDMHEEICEVGRVCLVWVICRRGDLGERGGGEVYVIGCGHRVQLGALSLAETLVQRLILITTLQLRVYT